MVFSAIDPPNVYGKGFVHCELSWSADGKNYTRISPNTDFIPRGSIESKAFDSHICFASAHPVKLPNETRIYYMGGTPQPQLCTVQTAEPTCCCAGDGPHYSPAWPSPIHRNSSFGLATLRPDGFVAVRPVTGYTSGAGSISVNVSGPRMLITADTAPSGSVSLWCAPKLSGFAQSAQLTRRRAEQVPDHGQPRQRGLHRREQERDRRGRGLRPLQVRGQGGRLRRPDRRPVLRAVHDRIPLSKGTLGEAFGARARRAPRVLRRVLAAMQPVLVLANLWALLARVGFC